MALLAGSSTTLTTSMPACITTSFARPTTTIIRPALTRNFSLTPCQATRKGNRDGNKWRGVSAVRSSGFNHPLTVDNLYKTHPKPRPRSKQEELAQQFPTNPNHGLYGFFTEDKETLMPPEKEEAHGRAWTYHELVSKSFEDLHALYWKCVLEANRARTRHIEHIRLNPGYGLEEIRARMATIRKTKLVIKKVLVDRQIAFDEIQLMRENGKSIYRLEEDVGKPRSRERRSD